MGRGKLGPYPIQAGRQILASMQLVQVTRMYELFHALYFQLQSGMVLLPSWVSACCCVPSASIDHISD